MSLKGSGAVIPTVGAKVKHPLYPELGVGEVKTAGKSPAPGCCTGRIRWSTGQVSTHNLATLREVD